MGIRDEFEVHGWAECGWEWAGCGERGRGCWEPECCVFGECGERERAEGHERWSDGVCECDDAGDGVWFVGAERVSSDWIRLRGDDVGVGQCGGVSGEPWGEEQPACCSERGGSSGQQDDGGVGGCGVSERFEGSKRGINWDCECDGAWGKHGACDADSSDEGGADVV